MKLTLPEELVYRPDADEGTTDKKLLIGKERKVARALAERLRVLKVCVCGGACGMEKGSLMRRFEALVRSGGSDEPVAVSIEDVCAGARPHPACAKSAGAVVAHAVDAEDVVTLNDNTSLMQRHSTACMEQG